MLTADRRERYDAQRRALHKLVDSATFMRGCSELESLSMMSTLSSGNTWMMRLDCVGCSITRI
jgi:hypothetical protein